MAGKGSNLLHVVVILLSATIHARTAIFCQRTCKHVDVLPDAFDLGAVVKVSGTDGLAYSVPVGLSAGHVRDVLLSHDVQQLERERERKEVENRNRHTAKRINELCPHFVRYHQRIKN